MRHWKPLWVVAVALAIGAPAGYVASRAPQGHAGNVQVLGLPGDARLPSATVDSAGSLHVAFMSGQDVYYARRDDREGPLGTAVRVNHAAGVALGGMFRGPELAIGSDGLVNVLWYRRGHELKLSPAEQGPMFSRQLAEGNFGPATVLFDRPTDGHSLVATDAGILAAWVAGDSLWARSSHDGGLSFEAAADLGPLPCECCDTALVTGNNGVYLAYRDRTDNLRDVYLAAIGSPGERRPKLRLDSDSWRFNGCPMSGMSLARQADKLYAAWEHKGSILLSEVDLERWSRRVPIEVSGSGKYPAIATDGQTLLVAWKQRKDVLWKMYDTQSLQVVREGGAKGNSSDRPAVTHDGTGRYVVIP